MSLGIRRTRRPNGTDSGGAALNILVLVAGSALIVALVVHSQKSGRFDRASAPGHENPPPAAAPPKADEKPKPPVQPVPPRPPEVAHETKVLVPKPVEPALIGDAEYKLYHRRDCKLVKSIGEGKKVPFASAAQAFGEGCIPCKVCKPELPGREEEGKAPPEQAARPVSTVLVGNAAKKRYHRADCPQAASIEGGRKVSFKSPAAAFAAEYFPCRTCNPDLPALLADLPMPQRPLTGVLTDKDKRAMYKSLFALKGMLKGISTRERPYEVLSDRYRVPTTTVLAVEAEGAAAGWPTQ